MEFYQKRLKIKKTKLQYIPTFQTIRLYVCWSMTILAVTYFTLAFLK
jgi:hypothetical protein